MAANLADRGAGGCPVSVSCVLRSLALALGLAHLENLQSVYDRCVD